MVCADVRPSLDASAPQRPHTSRRRYADRLGANSDGREAAEAPEAAVGAARAARAAAAGRALEREARPAQRHAERHADDEADPALAAPGSDARAAPAVAGRARR